MRFFFLWRGASIKTRSVSEGECFVEPSFLPRLRVLKLRFFSHEVAAAPSCGRQPADLNVCKQKAPKGRKQAALLSCCRRFAALQSIMRAIPWAYAHGYVLPSLRDSGNMQLQSLRFGLVLAKLCNFKTCASGSYDATKSAYRISVFPNCATSNLTLRAMKNRRRRADAGVGETQSEKPRRTRQRHIASNLGRKRRWH